MLHRCPQLVGRGLSRRGPNPSPDLMVAVGLHSVS